MKNKNDSNEQEQVTDVKGTIVGFVAPDPQELSQEEEIQEFRLKRQTEKDFEKLSEEEQKKKRKEYQEEEEKLEGVKAELLRSIRERIPAIEKRFKLVLPAAQKGRVVEKVKTKTRKNIEEKDSELQNNQNKVEKERD